jgi:hypothetical protein
MDMRNRVMLVTLFIPTGQGTQEGHRCQFTIVRTGSSKVYYCDTQHRVAQLSKVLRNRTLTEKQACDRGTYLYYT